MRILGVDWGEQRIGFAVSDDQGIIAMPIETVSVANEDQALLAVSRFIAQTRAEKLVLGLPINMDGTVGPIARKVQNFAARLSERIQVPLETWDERLSTSMAERVLLEANVSREKRKRARDRMAAQIILQGYLDAQNRGDAEPEDVELP